MTSTLKRFAFVVAGTIVAIALSFLLPATAAYDLATASVFCLAILGLSFLTGWSGQISLGNSGFMMIGAYATGLWSNHHTGWPFALALVIGTAVASLAGAIVGFPATKLRGPYLAGMTLAFAVALPSVLQSLDPTIFGGSQGITVTPLTTPHWFASLYGANDLPIVMSNHFMAVVGILVVSVGVFIMTNLFASKTGRAMRLVRDNDVAAELVGLHLGRTRALAFVITAAYSGLAGGLLTLFIGTAAPTTPQYTFNFSIVLLTLMVLGGMGTIAGSVVGAMLGVYAATFTTWFANHVGLGPTSWVSSKVPNLDANLQPILFGVLLIVTMIFAPQGVAGQIRGLGTRLQRRFSR
jgi:branched-chain amino acid transport system permease protein